MSEACEDFLRGQGRLAGLLWELSPYEPPATLEASFLAAARAAQMSVGAASGRSYEHQPAFEAPTEMAARFSQLAAQVDAAQATRREAVLGRIAAGDAPQAVLGAPVQPETAAWLKQQACAAKPAKPKRKPVLWGFSWFDLRLAALATILAAVSTQWMLKHAPTSVEMALLEAFQRETTPFADAQPDQPQNQVGAAPPAAPALARSDDANRQVASHASTTTETHTEPTPQPLSAEAPPAGGAIPEETPALAAVPEKKSAVALETRHERAKSDAAEALARPAPRLMSAAPQAMAAPAAQTQIENSAANAAAKPVLAASVAVAPPTPAAPSPELLERQRSQSPGINASLTDDPASIAARLPARPAGRVWVVYHSESRQAELTTWLEALRIAIPEAQRPARFELRSESPRQDAQGRALMIRIVPPPLDAPAR